MSEKASFSFENAINNEILESSAVKLEIKQNIQEIKEKKFFFVVFERNLNKKKGRVTYVNSDPTFKRKRIVLENRSPIVPEDGEPYEVEVIRDTNPDDPSQGEFIVRIVPDIELVQKDREAQFHRAARLRESVHFQVLAQIVRRNPEVFEEMQNILARREEFYTNLSEPGEHHRDFTALFAALNLNERTSVLLDEAIDRTTEAETEWIKEQIRAGNNYVHELIIGTGVHSAAYRQERLMYIPEDPGLAVDRNSRIGGQFAQLVGPAFRMNSRTRPENKNFEHLPGTEGSLNSQGTRAVLQSSDISAEIYPTTRNIASAIRSNDFMIGKNIVNLDLKQVIPVFGNTPGYIKQVVAKFMDPKTNEEFEIITDRLILPSGIGSESSGLDEEQMQTREILEQSELDIKNGKSAKIYKSSQLSAMLADPTNPFPQRGIKRVISWGKGDSFKVSIGGILGHEGQMGNTVTQLDRVEEVIAIGQEFLTKEEWIKCERARYHTLGLEFPREEIESYYHRIKPLEGRGLYLENIDGITTLVAEIKNKDGKTTLERFPMPDGTIGVSAAGYKDNTEEIFSSFAKSELGPEDLKDEELKQLVFRIPGAIIEYKAGALLFTRKIEIVSYDPQTDAVEAKFNDSTISEFINTELYIGRADSIEKVTLAKPILLTEKIFAPGMPDPVAIKYKGVPVQRIGPAAKLKLTDNEKQRAPVLDKIPENSAAIFRYIDYVVATAQLNAKADIKRGIKPRGLSLLKQNRIKKGLPSLNENNKTNSTFATTGFGLSTDKKTAEKRLPKGSNISDLLNFVIGEQSGAFTFPKNLDAITLHVARAETRGSQVNFSVSTSPKLPIEYSQLLENIFSDQLMQRIIRLLTEKRVSTSSDQLVDIKIPFIEKDDVSTPYVGAISYSIPLGKKK